MHFHACVDGTYGFRFVLHFVVCVGAIDEIQLSQELNVSSVFVHTIIAKFPTLLLNRVWQCLVRSG